MSSPKTKAFALIHAVFAVLLFSLLSASLFVLSQNTEKVASTSKSKSHQEIQLESELDNLARTMRKSNFLLLEDLLEFGDSTPLLEKIRNSLNDPGFEWLDIYQASGPQFEIYFDCKFEYDVNQELQSGCTADSRHMPKVFEVKITTRSKDDQSFSNVHAYIDLQTTRLSDFAMLVSAQRSPVFRFGGGHYNAKVGIFFDRPFIDQPGAPFWSQVAIGFFNPDPTPLIFTEGFYTNLEFTRLKPANEFSGYGGFETGPIDFQSGVYTETESVASLIQKGFNVIRNTPSFNIQDQLLPNVEISGSTIIQRETIKYDVYLGNPVNPCEIRFQVQYSVDICPTVGVGGCTTTTETQDISKVSDDQDIILITDGGDVSPVSFATDNIDYVGTVCHRATFVTANGGHLKNSIRRSDFSGNEPDPREAHTAFISFGDGFIVDDNSFVYETSQSFGTAAPIADDEIGFLLEASFVRAAAEGKAIEISSQLMDEAGTDSWGIFKFIGSIITPQQMVTKMIYSPSDIRGFQSSDFDFIKQFINYPPPGFESQNMQDFTPYVRDVEFKQESVEDALAFVENL